MKVSNLIQRMVGIIGSRPQRWRILSLPPEKHEGWVNVYKEDKFYNVGNLFSSKEDALAVTKGDNVYVATIKIEWEE